jgi:hypothetical protein
MSALRRHGTTLALVALAAAAGVALFVDRGSVTTTERATRSRNLLVSFHEDDVDAFKVTAQGQAARVFRGPADAVGQRPWQVEIDGATWPAEEPVVDQYLAALKDGVVARWLHGAAEDAGEARTLIAVEMGSRRALVTLRGPAPTPPGSVYAEVQAGAEPVTGVISAQLAAVLAAAPASFRQKALVTWGPAEVMALSLDGEGGPRHLVRSPWLAPRGGSFRFDRSTPEGDVRASAAALERVWDAVGKLTAERFLSPAEADQAGPRQVTLTLRGKAGARLTIAVGGACPGHAEDVVATRRDEAGHRLDACVPQGALEALVVPVAEVVDRRLVGARAEEVIDVKLASGATTLALARSGSRWHQQAPVDRVLETEVGKAFVDRLLELSATRLVSGEAKALGLDPPRATLRVVSLVPASGADAGDVERTELLEIGAEQGGVVHVRRVEDGAVAELPAEAATALLPDDVTLRPRKINDVSFASFRSLRVASPGRVQRLERGADGTWTLVEPRGSGLAPDAALLSDLGDTLGGLTVDHWVGAARPEHGLGRPRLVVEAELGEAPDAGQRGLRVAVGAAAGAAGSFAQAGDDPLVFVAQRRLEDAADRWLVDRMTLISEVSRVTRVTLTAPAGKRAVLEASGGGFHVAGAAADPVANARAAAVREALADLVSEGAVSVGKPEKQEGLDRPALTAEIEIDGKRTRLVFGAGDTFKGTTVLYARKDGVDATFAVAQAKVRPLLEAVGVGR